MSDADLFHVLWTKAVGTRDYDKEQWKQLENSVHGPAQERAAVDAFALAREQNTEEREAYREFARAAADLATAQSALGTAQEAYRDALAKLSPIAAGRARKP